jgi:hemerythrin
MAYLVWQDDLNTGIQVIDNQHKRIVEMINHLDDAQAQKDSALIGGVIEELVDYTQSHFAFEEALLEDAGYQFTRAHKKVHELFIKRVSDYRLRYAAGEDIADELKGLLGRWVVQPHPQRRRQLRRVGQGQHAGADPRPEQRRWLGRSMKRFFG